MLEEHFSHSAFQLVSVLAGPNWLNGTGLTGR